MRTLERPARVYTWTPGEADKPPETRRAYTNDVDADGIRTWAAQILTAYRLGRDPEVLYEVWQEGNRTERAEAKRLCRAFGHPVP